MHHLDCEDRDYDSDDLLAKLKACSEEDDADDQDDSFDQIEVKDNKNKYLLEILFTNDSQPNEDASNFYKILYI
jgi:hypothetical protein